MDKVKRLFVEKKDGCNIEAIHIMEDIKENLGITSLESLRILQRYDIENVTDEDFEKAKNTIFSEPPVDIVYEECVSVKENEYVFATEYLPGQYDQRADSAEQCIKLISKSENPIISVAKVYILSGNITIEEIEKIKKYCINPVDSREAKLEKPETLTVQTVIPDDVAVLDGFIEKTEEEMQAFKDEYQTAMSLADLLFCKEYFKNTEKRNPTETEIKVIDTYWSDHCRHTTFQTKINEVEFEDGYFEPAFKRAYDLYLKERDFVYGEKVSSRDMTLMDIAVIGAKSLKKQGILDNLDISDEINACSIVVPVDVDGVTEEWLIMFKNETHNHPTEIEPFGGAATCLGGAIRDPLSGRSYVYQAMRVTGAADPTVPVSKTLEGKLPQIKIVTEAAKGYSSYGNQIGLATGQVSEVYDPDFAAKRMEIGAVIAAAKKENVIRETPKDGDLIILTGGRTGRDGCGGATGSSKEHTASSIETCGAEVQKGNPPTERKLQRLFRNEKAAKLIKRCNDFGAGGVSVAIGELADGLLINLDNVPKKYEGLNGTELAISESQERMAVVVAKEDAETFIKLANEENLEATVVAEVKDNRRLTMEWRGDNIVDISRDFLDTNGVTGNTDIFVKCPENVMFFKKTSVSKDLIEKDIKTAWEENIKLLNVASQKGLCERFDSTIGANTVLMPFGGENQLTKPEAMVAKVPVLNAETNTVTLMSYGYHSDISKLSPFHGAVYAVVESLSKIVATGGDYKKVRLTFQEYFEKLGTDKEKWGKPFSALIGALLAQIETGTAAIGGKDSMSGTFMNLNVPPTLVSFAVAAGKVSDIISPEFKNAGNTIVYLPVKKDKYDVPDFKYLKKLYEFVEFLIRKRICISASVVKSGGIAECITKMSFGNNIGVKFQDIYDKNMLFAPLYGSFVLELANFKEIDFNGLDAVILGETIKEEKIFIANEALDIKELVADWERPLEKVFPTKTKNEKDEKADIPIHEVKEKSYPKLVLAKPRVFIPVFPGTNCEYDSEKAFRNAGAEVNQLVVLNGNENILNETIDKMVELINNSQIIMLPGGFSAGDEPDGSGKFIAAIFRNPKVKEAVMNLLNNRDGLMLGVCNGFQALIKLGLVPYGEIKDMTNDSPTLTFNNIGRHVSCLVKTKIVSNKSPWLWGVEVNDIHTIPVSHGEGRFIAPEHVINALKENGQIATQYVDLGGNPTMDIKHNPNGSMLAIEGITSPDGRVFGKMGHSERIGNGLYKNVPGNYDQKIFKSGVDYFK